ncbi:heavy-metal-associated domain-containing protein [Rhizobium sp. Root651]|uniref:heavy-metal-associated domain-containing protein n=1 Tax=Rhizobium sp. Root651 TaxID=1736577 RepID=UPI0007146E41|nr:heavy-metal-associated domain-containing protein [Rhizobium sp. Root651]KRA61173.1 hypothetical protein ASD85_27370 [Rhizobium sp. Root651]
MKTLHLIALTASLLASGAAFAAEQTVTLNVANATCELCGPIVKRALSNVSGVLAVDVSEATDGAIALAAIGLAAFYLYRRRRSGPSADADCCSINDKRQG